MTNNEKARMLNALVRGKFEMDKDCDNYIYASLSQPPIKIISTNNSDCEFDFTVECPNCKCHVNYGSEIFMISGHIYCPNGNCMNEVYERVKNK